MMTVMMTMMTKMTIKGAGLRSSRSVVLMEGVGGWTAQMMMMMVMMMLLLTTGGAFGQSYSGERIQPPELTDPLSEATRYEKMDAPVTLTCQASGTGTIIYQWTFKGDPVTPTNPPTGRVTFSKDTGTLTIDRIGHNDTGPYRCLASNSYTTSTGKVIGATTMSQNINVHLAYVATWEVVPRPVEDGTQGQYMPIRCDTNLPAFDGPTEFKWYRRSLSNIEVIPNERIFIDRQGTLHFSYLLLTDDENNLPYSCALSNSVLGTIMMGSRVDLSVLNAGLTATGPTLQYPTNALRRYHVNATRGTSAYLECFYSGYALGDNAPSVVWSDNGNNQIVSGGSYRLSSQGRVLEILGVDEKDEGDYFCQGKLGGVETMGVKIMLNVTSPPVWNPTPLQSQTVLEGKNAVLHCNTRSLKNEEEPGPPIWYRNGKHLHRETGSEGQKWSLSNRNRTLTVTNVSKDTDIACYQCVVSNSVGETFGSGCLNVILPIKVLTQPPAEQVVSPGDIVDLTVVATSDPLYDLTYEWTFRNATYKGDLAPRNVTYDSVTKMAYINTTGFSSELMRNISGLYRRRVFHRYDSITIDVNVKLRADEIAVAGGFQYWIIGLIIGLIIILIILIICCCVLCRRKMQEGDYPVDKKEHDAGLDPAKELEEGGFQQLSRAHDPYKQKKTAGDLDDGMSIKDESSFGSADYDFEPTEFNEDGSFINAYRGKDKEKEKDKDKTPVENPAFNPQTPEARDNPRYNNNNNNNYNNPNNNPNNNREPLPPRENPTQRRPQEGPREIIIPRYQNVPSPTRESPRYSYPNGQPWENPAFNPNESAV